MKAHLSALLLLLMTAAGAYAQRSFLPAANPAVNPALLDPWSKGDGYNGAHWTAKWITSPQATNTYDVLMFRKVVSLAAVPSGYVINVSADSRYKLYVNGRFVTDGPAKGDPFNWSFETVDIAPFLNAGDNVIAALVWNQGPSRPVAVSTIGKTAFLVQGNSEAESEVNTEGSWRVMRTTALSPVKVKVRGYYAAGACDRLDASQWPWGWESLSYDDSDWSGAKVICDAAIKGSRDYPNWFLVPRRIPLMEREATSFGSDFPVTEIPAGTTRSFLLDNSTLTTGYPRISFSGGAHSKISIGYAEALYEPGGTQSKGHRDLTEGKDFVGYEDIIRPDGGQGRSFEPLWWRTWRYMKVTVETQDEPLVIDGISAESSMYPLTLESRFSAPGDPQLERMLTIGWRTARLCAHETYMDCPYYEQLQYFGDARIQALVTMYNTRDTCLVRNLIDHGRMSMSSDGITMSRYPSSTTPQFIPPYSLIWINTCHDWWMYRGDEEFLRTMLPSSRSILTFFRGYTGEDGTLSGVPFWNFADWADLDRGGFPVSPDRRSSYMDLVHLLALKDAAEMEEAFGDSLLAVQYRRTAALLKSSIKDHYWSPSRRFFADNTSLDSFSQHANALAILADVVTGAQAADLCMRTLSDESLRPCTIYFRYYLQAAMAHCGQGDLLLGSLGVLRDQMALGLTTWAEKPEPAARSDCHAWGSSPNVEFFRMVLGIDSAAPGFDKVRIAPCPGYLQEASGSIPHPKGEISVSYTFIKNGAVRTTVNLPEGVEGWFEWNGATRPLKGGRNSFTMK